MAHTSDRVPRRIECRAAVALGVAVGLTGCNPSETKEQADQRIVCANRMHMLGLAMSLYACDHEGQFPRDLGSLAREEALGMDLFVCPATGHTLPPDSGTYQDPTSWVNAHSDFTYIRPAKPTTDGGLVVCYEADADHGGRGINVLYADGKTAFLPLDEAHGRIAAAAHRATEN